MTTSIILDGSETSLKNALLVLKGYAKISGFGVNVDKTSLIWIGSMRNSNIILCRDYSLHWEKEKCSLLGITMSTRPKLVVIKSLVIPKLNHLFIGLPNPSVDFIKSLQNMCFNFLWKNGPDKIRRQVVMQGYEKEGLRMEDINQFINAFKISWIRRSITEEKDCFIIDNKIYPFYKNCLIYGSD